MRFQVIARDDYGQTSINGTHNSIDDAISQCRQEVSSLNFENALTTDNKFDSVEAFMVDIFDENYELSEDFVYAGNMTDGRHRVLNVKTGNSNVLDDSYNIYIYIGNNEGQDYYLKNHKDEYIQDIESDFLNHKSYFYVKGI